MIPLYSLAQLLLKSYYHFKFNYSESKPYITLSNVKLYYKAIVIKTVWYWHKNRYRDQWNKIESPEINPHLHGQLIYDKGGKNIQWGKDKDNLFNQRYWENWIDTCKKIKPDHLLIPYTRINSKYITDLNVRLRSIKILEKSKGSEISDISLSNIFSWLIFSVKGNKRKHKCDYIKQKSFWRAKETIN